MSVIFTNGQSWEQIAEDFTLSRAYAPAIAIQNNMENESITGKRFRIEIPDSWMKPEYEGKSITLPQVGQSITGGSITPSIIPGVPNWMLFGGAAMLLMLLLPSRPRKR